MPSLACCAVYCHTSLIPDSTRAHFGLPAHRQYLQSLLSYLEQFYDRTNPLGSLNKVYGKLEGEFDSAFEEGQVPGWEDRGAGMLPGQQGSAMDLQAFDTVDELESLGQCHPASSPCCWLLQYNGLHSCPPCGLSTLLCADQHHLPGESPALLTVVTSCHTAGHIATRLSPAT